MCTTAALLACGDSPGNDVRRDPLLIGSDQTAADTIEATLVTLQRDLIFAITTADSEALSTLVGTEFVIHDTRTWEATPMSVGEARRPQQLSYVEVLAGGLRDQLNAEQMTYSAVPDGETATVYAIGQHDAARTTWRHHPDSWQASQLIIMGPLEARRMLEESRWLR